MAISAEREQIYAEDEEDIQCPECMEILEPKEAFTCEECSQDFCAEHIKNHKC